MRKGVGGRGGGRNGDRVRAAGARGGRGVLGKWQLGGDDWGGQESERRFRGGGQVFEMGVGMGRDLGWGRER